MILLNTDSLMILRAMKSNAVRAIISDPPYGLDYRDNQWDNKIPEWIEQARRVAEFVLFTTAPTTQWDYPRPDWVLMWHRRAAASRSVIGGFNHWSPILVYGKPRFKIDSYETQFGKTVQENKGIIHPSPKPLELYKWLVSNTCSPGDAVLDPFMGSGTTGVACVELGINFIGIEISPDYFQEAQSRIESAKQQLLLI